jgi:hypothetical protein
MAANDNFDYKKLGLKCGIEIHTQPFLSPRDMPYGISFSK